MLEIFLIATFLVISALHLYWAFRGQLGSLVVLPEVDGRPAFVPSRLMTVAVALALAGCALLVAALSGLLGPVPAPGLVRWLGFALALVLTARAIGDFRLVGFFKRVRGTQFAKADTMLYSPLCLALAVGVFVVTLGYNP